MPEQSYVADQVARADAEALRASWSIGMDITRLRPGAWHSYMDRRYDEILAGLENGSGAEPESEPESEDSPQ